MTMPAPLALRLLPMLLGGILIATQPARGSEAAVDPLIAKYRLAVPDLALCNDAGQRDAFMREAEQNPPDQSLAANYNARREEQLTSRMNAVGLNQRERGQIAMNALNHPEFKAALASNLDAVKAMIAAAQTAAEARDPADQCRAVIEMRSHLASTIDGANRQWDLMDRMVAEEATRRGKALP